MRNWLIRFLLSLLLAFFFLQGQSSETTPAHQAGIYSASVPSFQESVIAVKIQAQREPSMHEKAGLSHKKNHSVQKLFFADGDDDDDDRDETNSSRENTQDKCFFSNYFASANPLCLTKERLHFGYSFSPLSSNKHLLHCSLRI